MKKVISLVFFSLLVSGVYAQNINKYKYIIIPKKFNILKDTNQYQLNTLTKLLFRESGFTAIYDDVFPEDLQENNCLGLKLDLLDDSGIFSTKLKIALQDCKKQVVFTSSEGKNRKKDYKKAYQEALRAAFRSMKALHYKYTPVAVKPVVKNTTQPIEKTATENTEDPVKELLVKEGVKILYAQPVTNGFQLVDGAPKVVYIIQKTNLDNFYIIKDRNGVLYKKENNWVAEYYDGSTLMREILTIKF